MLKFMSKYFFLSISGKQNIQAAGPLAFTLCTTNLKLPVYVKVHVEIFLGLARIEIHVHASFIACCI